MTRSRLILLDANVVIRLFELGIWERIAARHHVLLARTVLDESQFYEDAHGRQYIDWDRWSAAGTFEVRQAPPSEVAAYCRRFDPGYMEKLDAGEAESLLASVPRTLDPDRQPGAVHGARRSGHGFVMP